MTTTETTPDLNILIRIEKLLAKGDDPGCTIPEREAFQNKAFELMARHRIDRSQVGGHLAADDVIGSWPVANFNGIYGRVRIDIATSIASANDLQLYWSGYQNTRHVKVYGFKSDADRAIALINRLLADADVRVKFLEKSYDMKDTLRQRRGFYSGYADAIHIRLMTARVAAERSAEADGVDTTSTALVLVDRKRQVNEEYQKMNIRQAGSINVGGADGYDSGSGTAAGRNADLSNRNSVGTQKELGR